MIKIKETIRFHHNKRNLTTIFCFESFCSFKAVPSKTTECTLKENKHIAFPRTIQLLWALNHFIVSLESFLHIIFSTWNHSFILYFQPGIIPLSSISAWNHSFTFYFSLESFLHVLFQPGIIPSRSIFRLKSFLHVLFSAWNDSVRRRRWCCGWCSRRWFGYQLPTDQCTFAEGCWSWCGCWCRSRSGCRRGLRRDKGRFLPSAKSWRHGFMCQSPWCHQNSGARCGLTSVDVVVDVVQDYDVIHVFRSSSSVPHYACMYVLHSHLSVLHSLSCSFSIFRKLRRTFTTYDRHQFHISNKNQDFWINLH